MNSIDSNNLDQSQLLFQGAEGVRHKIKLLNLKRIYLSELFGKKCVVKERFEKKYRIKQLDQKITRQRIISVISNMCLFIINIIQESRNLARASKFGINTPYILFVDLINRKIYMQYIENSVTLKEILKIIYSSTNINLYDKRNQ